MNVTHHALAAKTADDLGKRATATSWGSSGRRFKSCQPDRIKPALTSIGAGFLLPRYGGTGGSGGAGSQGGTGGTVIGGTGTTGNPGSPGIVGVGAPRVCCWAPTGSTG